MCARRRKRMDMLEKAIELAVEAHKGAVDKGGHPYILHPLRVMMSIPAEEKDARIVAVLHDIVEDTDLTLDHLREFGFSDVVVDAIDAVTKREEEDYFDFVKRAKANPVARIVKIADIKDNMDTSRLKEIAEWDLARMEKYKKALEILNE
jgi:(p)ppGpp synthase/HD superfamily hydrolase